MIGPAPQPKLRADYRPPDYQVIAVALIFKIGAAETEVHARLSVARQPSAAAQAPLCLDGRDMALRAIAVNGQTLAPARYRVDGEGLTIDDLPAEFELETVVALNPDANTALEGLYRSGSILCTQCEAEGFSRITYFPDRPDVMARYTTRIEADAGRYPVLLSNGNCVDAGTLDRGRHYAVYADPFAKPCYLFALVAGDLALVTDSFQTASGRDVALRFYTEHGSQSELAHAVASLKQAMAWDEAVYGLEYDLDTYMVVAVGSFNMGAMENKGLNIFNTACVLASPETATDRDFATVRDVIAHEYFHNYTGNRVTCRDWFQLSLKESLTVFREQQFAADHGSPGVTRIEQIRLLRDIQFPEDAGPNAHPVRPESYVEMNNFYSITIYEKGAEIIRLLARLLGRQGFIRAVRYYLTIHDGQAVTIEDFIAALEKDSDNDLTQFRRWYAQAGTPVVTATDSFDADTGEYRLSLAQHTPETPGQSDKPPLYIPIGFGLVAASGSEIDVGERYLLHLTESQQTWRFTGLTARPTPSLLRDFSAPVKLLYDYEPAQLAQLLVHDSDPVARWEAGQRLALAALSDAVAAHAQNSPPAAPDALIAALTSLLEQPPDDPELLAEMLSLPAESFLADQYDSIDVDAVVAAHAGLKRALGAALQGHWQNLLAVSEPAGPYRFDAAEVGRRRLAGLALDYLAAADVPGLDADCLRRFRAADNMSDRMAALTALRDRAGAARDTALAEFEILGSEHALVLDKWFALHAASRIPGALTAITGLLRHPGFSLTNPNRVRALLGTVARANMPVFHAADGSGYRLIANTILELDPLNPQIAARLVAPLAHWRRHAGARRLAIHGELVRIQNTPELSPHVLEMADQALA